MTSDVRAGTVRAGEVSCTTNACEMHEIFTCYGCAQGVCAVSVCNDFARRSTSESVVYNSEKGVRQSRTTDACDDCVR